MKYHIAAFFGGFLLDLILGDPYCLPHPVRLIGKLIAKGEKVLLPEMITERNQKKEFQRGLLLVVFVLVCTVFIAASILFFAYWFNLYIGVIVEVIMTYQILATKCLKVESMKVYVCLKNNDLEAARKAVSMIVGRDTQNLNAQEVTKAAVETVAENTSDGVIAPMIYTAIGGPILGFLYKAVNTMDSMIGYKNEKYLYFGRVAAKLDDFVNYIPSRISAYIMIVASFLGGKQFSWKNAYVIYRRDSRNHASPNSAQTESVCAGALGIRLGGDASYFGKLVKKPYIGDFMREAGSDKITYKDIKHANRLMYITAFLSELLCLLLMAVFL